MYAVECHIRWNFIKNKQKTLYYNHLTHWNTKADDVVDRAMFPFAAECVCPPPLPFTMVVQWWMSCVCGCDLLISALFSFRYKGNTCPNVQANFKNDFQFQVHAQPKTDLFNHFRQIQRCGEKYWFKLNTKCWGFFIYCMNLFEQIWCP